MSTFPLSKTLCVSNLPGDATNHQLRELLRECVGIVDVEVKSLWYSTSKCIGFATFDSISNAQRALDDSVASPFHIRGRAIGFQFAREKKETGSRTGSSQISSRKTHSTLESEDQNESAQKSENSSNFHPDLRKANEFYFDLQASSEYEGQSLIDKTTMFVDTSIDNLGIYLRRQLACCAEIEALEKLDIGPFNIELINQEMKQLVKDSAAVQKTISELQLLRLVSPDFLLDVPTFDTIDELEQFKIKWEAARDANRE